MENRVITPSQDQLDGLKLENVVSVYNGKIGCMCGCLGKYSYSSSHREFGSKDRGYEVTDDEVNDKRVKLLFNKVMKDENVKLQDGNILFIENGTRTTVIYFK